MFLYPPKGVAPYALSLHIILGPWSCPFQSHGTLSFISLLLAVVWSSFLPQFGLLIPIPCLLVTHLFYSRIFAVPELLYPIWSLHPIPRCLVTPHSSSFLPWGATVSPKAMVIYPLFSIILVCSWHLISLLLWLTLFS